jgi:hypothetical protein
VVARTNCADWLAEPSTHGGKDPFRGLAERYGLKTPGDRLDALATLLLPMPLSTSSRVLCEHELPDLHQVSRRLLSLPEAQVG